MIQDKILLEILKNRGINENEIDEFLSEKPQKTYSPFLLLNMREGVDLILSAIDKNEKICIYGDYDADGITSISILMSILKKLTENVMFFIPNRFDDGYGLNKKSIKQLHDDGVDLIVTVDCGITAISETEYCKELGMNILITDHHSADGEIPSCIVINPKQNGCEYPFKDLAGCGVAFKLAQAIQQSTKLKKTDIAEILDIAAIGTVGDIVPLLDENRTIVKYGLSSVNKNKRVGIASLVEKMGGKERIDSQSIAFGIVPHLNAAGRMKSAMIGVDLFTASKKSDANIIADKLIELNACRRREQEKLFEICKAEFEKKYLEKRFPFIILNEAHEGVTGIVAGKLKDYAKRPIAILTKEKNSIDLKGTARSLEKIDIYRILSKYKGLFEKFGGHKGACGFTISLKNYESLVENIEKDMRLLADEDFNEEIEYDCILKEDDVTMQLAKNIRLLAPFGFKNSEPLFKIKDCLIENLFFMGKEDEHIKLRLQVGNKYFDAIMFFYENSVKDDIKKGSKIDIICNIGINVWRNRENIQLQLYHIDIVQ